MKTSIFFFLYVILGIVFIPMLIVKTLDISIYLSVFLYIINTGLNFIFSAIAMMHQHGAEASKKFNLSYEAEYDFDRCVWFIPAGPLGTLLIISNIILNIINKF